ncbi:MAG: hypothetical protein ACOC8F_01955 [Planctomycetota bacterium]
MSPPDPTAPPDATRRRDVVVPAALALAAAAMCLTRVWSYDIFWHLAGGQWMLEHLAVLGRDPFSIAPQPEWINVHWLFQVIVACVHGVAGFAGLSVLKAVLGVALAGAFLVAVRREVPPAWALLTGLWMLLVTHGRIRARPEALTFVLLMLTIFLLDSVRRGAHPRRLWWLVPVHLAWVNMHGLFVLGLAVTWTSVGGAWLDRRLRRDPHGALATPRALAPVLVATVACLLTPWPFEAVAQPLVLWTRISGQAYHYTYGVSELAPTLRTASLHHPAVLTTIAAAAVCFVARRRVPLAHGLWLAGVATVALLAARNLALVGPVGAYLLAVHGADLLRRVGRARPKLRRASGPALGLGLLLSVGAVAGYATETVYRVRGSRVRFGAGLQAAQYPRDLAQWLAELPADGDVYCENFGDASVFLYHFAAGRETPRRRLFMDGRLEAHSLERFIEHNRIRQHLLTATLAERVELPPEVRFVIVSADAPDRLAAMVRSERFRLLRVDRTAACFGDTRWLERLALPRREAQHVAAGATDALDGFDHPLQRRGRGPAVTGVDLPLRRWYRRNPPAAWHKFGRMLRALGTPTTQPPVGRAHPVAARCTVLALRYLETARAAGVADEPAATGEAARAYQQRMVQCGVELSHRLSVNVHAARALHLYRQLDLQDLSDPHRLMYALHRVRALLRSYQFDAAERAVRDVLTALPPAQRVNPPQRYLQMHTRVLDKIIDSERKLSRRRLEMRSRGEDVDPLSEARLLASQEIGLPDRAIAALRAVPAASGESLLLLGDLLLEQGRAGEAREAYDRAATAGPGPGSSVIEMRQYLCDWAEGKVVAAAEGLDKRRLVTDSLATPLDRARTAYYAAVAWFELGWSDRAMAALSQLKELAGRHEAARYHYALALRNCGRFDEAERQFELVDVSQRPGGATSPGSR